MIDQSFNVVELLTMAGVWTIVALFLFGGDEE
jgi:hypothetical protein